MAPVSLELFRRTFTPGLPSKEFLRQWKTPGDVFSVLLILGGDVVLRALAQLSGSGITPVAFSFGKGLHRSRRVFSLLTTTQDGLHMPSPQSFPPLERTS